MRYKLRDKQILKYLMDHPGRGVPYSIRTLADAIGRTHSLVHNLLTGRRIDAEAEDAHAIAEAVGVAILVLFAPPPSPDRNDSATQ